MLLNIIASVAVLGITFYQVVQGMFSAMVMAILTILSAAVAFNFYEPLAELLGSRLGAYTHAVTLLAMFVIPLYVLREIFDRSIKGNVVLGVWADRVGGGLFGLLTGLILVGMLMIVLQLLPFKGSMLGYEPYDSSLSVADGGVPRRAAGCTLSIVKHLSGGSLRPMGKGNEYGKAHDNLELEAYCTRNRPVGASAWAPANGLEVVALYQVQMPEGKEAEALTAEQIRQIRQIRRNIQIVQQGMENLHTALLSPLEEQGEPVTLAVRVAVGEQARDASDKWWRLPATHFRLVTASGRSFYPVAYLTARAGQYSFNPPPPSESEEEIAQARIGDLCVQRDGAGKGGPRKLIVDWIYRLPADEDYKPSYMVFRRAAKAPMPPLRRGLPSPADSKNRQIALGVKPKTKETKFDEVSGLLQPESMKVETRLPRELMMRFPQGRAPEAIKDRIQYVASKLMTADNLDVATSQLRVAVSRGTRGTTIQELELSKENAMIVHVRCKVQGRLDAALCRQMTPELVLDDGSKIPHIGAYFVYRAGGEQRLYFYYDPARSQRQFRSGLAGALAQSSATGNVLGLVFLVKEQPQRRVEMLDFGLGPRHVYYPEYPLACRRR